MKIRTGQLIISASAQQVTSTAQETVHYRLKAPTTNIGIVYIGPSGVTTSTGHALEPGDELQYDTQVESGLNLFDVPITDWFAVGTAGDKLTWLAHRISS